MSTEKSSHWVLIFTLVFSWFAVSCNRTHSIDGSVKNIPVNKRDSSQHFTFFDPPFIAIDNSSLKTPSVIYYDEGVAVVPNTIHELVYVVIADSGRDYYKLKREMKLIRKTLNIKINQGGCFYDSKSRSVCSPGYIYIPRHWTSDFLSIENYSDYDSASAHTMCLVAGVFATKTKADSLTMSLKYLGQLKPFVHGFVNYYM